MKNRAVTVFVLAYILLGSVYSVTPTFADNHFTTIESILNDSKVSIDEKFAEFVDNGLEIPQDADSLYSEGLAKYDEAIALLNSGDFENAKDPGLEALSLFEDAYEVIFSAEEELGVAPEGYVGDPFQIAESIIELQNRADEISNLISINDLDISLDKLDATILSANENFTQGNSTEALTLIESAEAILDEILDQIEDNAEAEQEERVKEFVENLLLDLEDIIFIASDLGVDDSVISQLQDLINELTNLDDPNDIFEITGASSHNKDALSDVGSFHEEKVKLEAELVDDETDEDGGKAKFEERIGDRIRLSIEIENVPVGSCGDFTATIDGDPVIGDFEFDETTPDGDKCDLNLDSRDGDTVPEVVTEHGVIVTNGDITLSGTFSLKGHDNDQAKEDDEEVDEIELEGILTVIDENTFSLDTGDEIFTISVDDETEIDDDLELSALDTFEVEVDAVATDDGLLATEIEFDNDEVSGHEEVDDDDSDNSGSGNSNDDDSDNSGSGNSNDDDSDNSGSD